MTVTARDARSSANPLVDSDEVMRGATAGRAYWAGVGGLRGDGLAVVADQSFEFGRGPAPTDIIGARRVRTAVMISSGSMPWR